MYKTILTALLLFSVQYLYCWGFYCHKKINEYAIYLLPPDMLVLFKAQLAYIRDHAVDADKRRYILKAEAPRHYIDLDHYGSYPFDSLPRNWDSAVQRFGADSLQAHGVLPWRIRQVMAALTKAFREGQADRILRYATDLGHYIGDAHVPLHTSSNHNGQHTGQHGIHAFWESRVPELLAEEEWDFLIGKARYIPNMESFTWNIILESAGAVDSVLKIEKQVSASLPATAKYGFEWRNQQVVRQYAAGYTRAYNQALKGMVERRMRQAIQAVADCWYTAWINAGQPSLQALSNRFIPAPNAKLDSLAAYWKKQVPLEKSCD